MDDHSPWVTLSRYIPKADEISALLHPHSVYQLERVSGWSQSPTAPAERRQVVQMLSEGSVLGPLTAHDPGEIVDVRPVYNGTVTFPHPIYRSGFAMAVSINHSGGTT
jgi:CRISPR/Cas system CSM-associated protein Csm4 (group 5 of RAMP superfamily)